MNEVTYWRHSTLKILNNLLQFKRWLSNHQEIYSKYVNWACWTTAEATILFFTSCIQYLGWRYWGVKNQSVFSLLFYSPLFFFWSFQIDWTDSKHTTLPARLLRPCSTLVIVPLAASFPVFPASWKQRQSKKIL